ncbi:MAG: PHB depolymerase family esterase [Myxococcota bacterium]|nr:PHB depolymerase family esterase [Myxococcota bacterium]
MQNTITIPIYIGVLIATLGLSTLGCTGTSSSDGVTDDPMASSGGTANAASSMPQTAEQMDSQASPSSDDAAAENNAAGNRGDAADIGEMEQIITHGGLERTYTLYVPERYDAAQPTPIVFNFHGNGQFVSSYINSGDLRPLADQDGFILVYPQGASGSEGTPEWNSFVGEGNKSETDDFGFIETIVARLSATYNVDPERIYAVGYSNGGFFAHALACFRSDLIAAVASVSGTMMENSIMNGQPNHPTAVIILHGTADFTVPYNGGMPGFSSVADTIEFWVNYNQLMPNTSQPPVTENGRTFEHITYSGGTGGVTLEHYKVEGGDHVWFDMTFGGSTTAEVVWRFISAYDKNGVRD